MTRPGVDRGEAAVVRRRPGRREDAAPVRVVAEEGGLDERRRGDAGAIARAWAAVHGAGDLDLREHRRALAVGDDLLARARRRPGRARARRPCREAGVRSIPLAPFASRQTASFVEHSPSTVIELKLRSTAGRRKSTASPGLERVVGRDDREHRRELRVDHPRALCHPADGEAVHGDRRLLRARVGRENRLGGVRPAARPRVRAPRHAGRRAPCRAEAASRSRRSRGRAPPRRRGRAAGRPRRRSRSASSSPRSPVAAFATPELMTIACGSATARCSFETTTGAA